jgi:hypothetical protein
METITKKHLTLIKGKGNKKPPTGKDLSPAIAAFIRRYLINIVK